MTGYVRVDSVTGGAAGMWLRVDGPTGILGFDNMVSFNRAIVGSLDWTEYRRRTS